MQSSQYEQVLRREGVNFIYEANFKLSDIDVAKSQENQARMEDGPIIPKMIDDYKLIDETYVKDGFTEPQFPPLVLCRRGKGKWIVADGNHRLVVYLKNGRKTCDAYLLQTEDLKIIQRITWTFNDSINGRRLTYAECMHHAISFIKMHDYPVMSAAKDWHLPPGVLYTKLRLMNARELLQKRDIRLTTSVTEEKLIRLMPIIEKDEDLFVRVVAVVSRTGTALSEVLALAKQITSARTPAAREMVVTKYENSERALERIAETKNGTRPVKDDSPRRKLIRLLKQQYEILARFKNETITPLRSEMEECQQMAREVIKRFPAIFRVAKNASVDDAGEF